MCLYKEKFNSIMFYIDVDIDHWVRYDRISYQSCPYGVSPPKHYYSKKLIRAIYTFPNAWASGKSGTSMFTYPPLIMA